MEKAQKTADALPSWKDGEAKERILNFVKNAADSASKNYIPPAERIAVFDNDGTLWNEAPMLFQVSFMFDRIKSLAAQNPDWKTQQPYKAVLENDHEAMKKFTHQDFGKLMAASHAGISPEEFKAAATQWFDTAQHPVYKRPYLKCVYQPQLELLNYLRENGFKNFIVSGGGVDFMRAFAEKTYGIPPEQIIGSSAKTTMESKDGKPALMKTPELQSFDDRAEKVSNINLHIGRRPVLACGNSDGDLNMLQYTAAGTGPNLEIYIHHDDAEREMAYEKHPLMGELKEGLVEAKAKNWIIVSMKNDWKKVFPD
ncbi:haloacid dehalogenase-like hydrolase [Adhaeribacter sp. BT258]|uniref:Haloacid dehalogenase-like hydrolase n=1 Tax=Adhaeribacter terrigena TaxID=2793070 RepID=A0ABS1BZB2_9BACT|nr:HAD family hydrolase [Adhaeribacter terrigena]MBK0402508.1 haloacid dehalogenase-like hydrolase [Adhaeribacter terrigena]